MCSSGIAGTVYQDLHLSIPTVHSYYGVLTADLPWQFVVKRASTNNLVHDRVKNVDCIIWDEVSMSSARILEIVNSIHNILESGQNKPLFFAGKQVIFVGEFLELWPVPNFLDEGCLMFESLLFQEAITHRYELKTILISETLPHQSCLHQVLQKFEQEYFVGIWHHSNACYLPNCWSAIWSKSQNVVELDHWTHCLLFEAFQSCVLMFSWSRSKATV